MLCVVAVVLIGCRAAASKRSATTAPSPASPKQVQAIRQIYQLQQPHVVVGVVTAARPQDRLVAVGDLATLEMRDGQIVQFIDKQQQVLTGGVVVRVLADS